MILPLVPGLAGAPPSAASTWPTSAADSGHAINLMAGAFPDSRFVGFDFSEDGIKAGREEAARWDLANARFEQRDVTNLDAKGRSTSSRPSTPSTTRPSPAHVLAGIVEALRPDGVFLMVDFAASSHLHENMDMSMAPFATRSRACTA